MSSIEHSYCYNSAHGRVLLDSPLIVGRLFSFGDEHRGTFRLSLVERLSTYGDIIIECTRKGTFRLSFVRGLSIGVVVSYMIHEPLIQASIPCICL